MRHDNFDGIGFSLLRIAEAVSRTRNVTRAAETLGLSQSAVSVGLARLRRKTGDELFVRTKSGMVPTLRGEEILEALRKSAAILAEALSERQAFVPAATTRQFSVAINQITQMTLLPRILRRLSAQAPLCRVLAVPIHSDTLDGLSAGTLDLAIGDIPEVQLGFFKRTVLTDDYSCLVASAHPRIGESMSPAQFEAEQHVVVTGVGSIMHAAEHWLRRKRIERKVSVQVPDFLGVDAIVANSDMIAMLPRTLAQMFASGRQLKLVPPPFPLPRSNTKIYWHERHHRDEGHRWFRQLVVDVLVKHGQRKA